MTKQQKQDTCAVIFYALLFLSVDIGIIWFGGWAATQLTSVYATCAILSLAPFFVTSSVLLFGALMVLKDTLLEDEGTK
jgi:hypothetical protein